MALKNTIQFFGRNRLMTDVALTPAEMDLTPKKLCLTPKKLGSRGQ